ncbi:hypothetical protein E4U55_006161, partial [Claviceps digitariae]
SHSRYIHHPSTIHPARSRGSPPTPHRIRDNPAGPQILRPVRLRPRPRPRRRRHRVALPPSRPVAAASADPFFGLGHPPL